MTEGKNGVDLPPAVRKFVSHPQPSPEWEGVTATHRDEGEGKTDVLICTKTSGGGYEWIKIAEST